MKRFLFLLPMFLCILIFVPCAGAADVGFTFSGTITQFDASQIFPVPEELPNIVSPGDTFTGTAFYNDADVESNESEGFEIYVNDGATPLVGGDTFIGGPGERQSSLTADELYINYTGSVTIGGPYSTSATAFSNFLSLFFAEQTGEFTYVGDSGDGNEVEVRGTIDSVQIAPEPRSLASLIAGLGLASICYLRHRRQSI